MERKSKPDRGERFRNIRVALGLSQTDMGQILGKTRVTVGSMEQGNSEIAVADIEVLDSLQVNAGPYLLYDSPDVFRAPFDQVKTAVRARLDELQAQATQ